MKILLYKIMLMLFICSSCINTEQDTVKEVSKASMQWIENFNNANIDGIANGYADDAEMIAKPFGKYQGRKNIKIFWENLINNMNATNLIYSDTKIEYINETEVHISSKWTMNIGEGIITNETWKKDAAGDWKLKKDQFEVLKQY